MVHKKVEKPQPQHILQKVLSNQTGEALMVTTPAPTTGTSESNTVSNVSSSNPVPAIINQQATQSSLVTPMQQPQPNSSSMIKSLLANKVMTSSTGTPETSQVAATNQQPQANLNVHQVTPSL